MWVIEMGPWRFIDFDKGSTLGEGDVDGSIVVGESMWELFLLSSQLYSEPKTAQKMSINLRKKI